jgi:hypothetical protein
VLVAALVLMAAWRVGEARADAAQSTQGLAKWLTDSGIRQSSEIDRAFLVEGEHKAWLEQRQKAGCVGYLAVGLGEIRDVDLSVHAEGGQALDEDLGVAPYAYVRACVTQGVTLVVSASMYSGRGELLLIRIEDAPRGIRLPPAELGFAVAAGGRLEPTREIGAGPDFANLITTLTQEEQELARMGYAAAGPPSTIDIRTGNALGPLPLLEGRCYRVMVRVPLVRGLMLELLGPDGSRVENRQPTDEQASVAICARVSGTYVLRVAVRPLRAIALVRAFEHPDALPEPGREAESLLRTAEARFALSARGFESSLLGQAWVEAELPAVLPVSVAQGQCYALAVVTAEDGPLIDIRLTDAQGRVLSRDEGRGHVPVLFHCASNAAALRLVVQSRGRSGRIAAWLGRESGRRND